MALNTTAVGKTTKAIEHDYKWQDAVLYALGIGAKAKDLDFLYEKNGPNVYPSYAVIPTFQACAELFDAIGGQFAGVVHGSQSITLHKPFAPFGTLRTVGKVAGIYDLKRFAQAVITTETKNNKDELICETEWTIMYMLDGNYGGEAPPASKKYRPPERPADWKVEDKTSPEQALLYRLSGDVNPLHADPEIAKVVVNVTGGKPILHGLCTYGFACRAIVDNECGGDPSKLKSFVGRFSKPVWPGDTLVIQGWRSEENGQKQVLIQVGTLEHPEEPVFTNSLAVIT